MNRLQIAIAAEFDLCEKVVDFLQQSHLEIEQLSIVEIYPFKEEQSLRFNNKAVPQFAIDEVEWSAFNYLLFAGDINQATHLAKAADAGCVVIDMQGVCANLSDVPVVVPNVNNEQLSELRQRNIVALPDPQITQLAVALNDLLRGYEFKQIFVSSLLPASYTNGETVSQLVGQTAQLLNGIPLDEDQQRLAFDVYPHRQNSLPQQLQKIFPQLAENVVFHQLNVPVFYGLTQMITLLSDYALDSETLLAQWQQNAEIEYHQEKTVTPVINGEVESHQDEVKLHISALNQQENGVQFWTVADEQRFNLAFMAVKLLKLVYQQGY